MNVFPHYVTILSVCFFYTDALMFHVSPNQKKCLREEIHKDVLVKGDYDVSEAHGQKANLKVYDIICNFMNL